MDRYIAIPIVPVSGTPYEKLVNVDSMVVDSNSGSGRIMVAMNTVQPETFSWTAAYTSSGAAVDADDVCGYISRALLAFNGVSGPVQKALDNPYFYFTDFSLVPLP